MHDYPSTLPGFLSDGYQYSQQNTIRRTQFQSGRSRLRLSAQVAPESYSLNTIMTVKQLAIFEAWLHHTVRYIEPMNIMIATANECGIKTVRLVDNSFAKEMINPHRYRVKISVEAEQQSIMTAAELSTALQESV